MPQKPTIIIYPHLNDRGGSFAQEWYVEFSYRIPGEEKARRVRIHKGLNKGTAKERYKLAEKIIAERTEWLKSGGHLHENNVTKVYEDELLYRNEAKTVRQCPRIRCYDSHQFE